MDTSPNTPVIIAFVSDLMFATRVEDAAEMLGFRVDFIEREPQISHDHQPAPQRQLGEHLQGSGAVLIEKLAAMQPALLIFDLNNQEIPWREWIALLTSVPATRRIPVLCFGSHIDVNATQAARDAGATAVVARSRFVSALPELVQKYARLVDSAGISEACQEPLSDLAVRGLEEFNRGEYFEAHELLELAWNEDNSPARELYRAVLQVGVAYLQIERANYNGAVKMFLRLRQWIDPLPPVCRGIDIAALREDSRKVHQTLLDLGPDKITSFDRSLFKPVRYTKE
jgi:predicted metal-dependent hydrolase/CheY-like chemotaxis protein